MRHQGAGAGAGAMLYLTFTPLLSGGAGASSPIIASAALPIPLPAMRAVPMAASAARPTTPAVTLTAAEVTATTAQPPSRPSALADDSVPVSSLDSVLPRADVLVRTEADAPLLPEQAIVLTPELSRLRLFDAQSGALLACRA